MATMDPGVIEMRNMAKQTSAAIEKMPEDIGKKIGDAMDQIDSSYGENVKVRLEKMREEFGDELFDSVAGGASLMNVLDRWTAEKVDAALKEMVTTIHKILVDNGAEKITTDHVRAFIQMGLPLI